MTGQEVLSWQRETTARDMALVLNARGYLAQVAPTQAAAAEAILALIPEGSKVGLGGSMTLAELGIPDRLREGPWRLIDRYKTENWEATMAAYKEALTADVFLTGVNAITRSGELVCRDSSGNRVSAMIFGPERLIVVAGVNKIVENLDEAFARLRRIAPLNCRRLGHKTPCAQTGRCADCLGPESMCNYTGIIHHGFKEKDRIHIILIPEDLGF